ncbi:MAG TPA: hypothetical protein VKO20_09375 [Desulfosalsimonadaceae bacterium]|nr:hypothetical protein [Desulfosalsimonadaceae bacterium]
MSLQKGIIRFFLLTGFLLVFTTVSASAADFSFHGDMNHRFLVGTNHNEWIASGGNTIHEGPEILDDEDVYDNFGEIKYRFWFEAASDNGDYKGVFATEVGGLRFGEPDKMDYSGDEVAMEVRWGYLDFQLPFVEQDSRVRMGLQPININQFLWKETVGGVKLDGGHGAFDYELGWLRGYEANVTTDDEDDLRDDQDALYARMDYTSPQNLNLGLFGLYQWQDVDDAAPGEYNYTLQPWSYEFKSLFGKEGDIGIGTIGVDGSMKNDRFFVNWDLMYQTGSLDHIDAVDLDGNSRGLQDYDLSSYFGHFDLGAYLGKSTLKYTFWYASGDDDPTDGDLDAFMATDVDIGHPAGEGSICLNEGSTVDDNFFTETPYIMDKGFIMNKLQMDYQASEKLKFILAGMYMLTAEDIEYTASRTGERVGDDELGFELDAFVIYDLYENLSIEFNAGYLAAGDGLDYFEKEQDGESDEDIYISTLGVRYKF